MKVAYMRLESLVKISASVSWDTLAMEWIINVLTMY